MPRPDYPLLLEPALKRRAWGGGRLGQGVGEAWDLSVHPAGPSTVRNGALRGATLDDVVDTDPDAFGGPIELLAKRLDCAQPLSVQVHPKTGDPKTEAWVVLEAESGAGVYHGFAESVDAAAVRAATEEGTLRALLRFVPVKRGDAVFVPSGTVHGIGGGLQLFELQQSADTTYRLYDWGSDRDTHLEKALECADLGACDPTPPPRRLDDRTERLLDTALFVVDRISGDGQRTIEPGTAWRALFLLEGSGRFGDVELSAPQTVLLPAAAGARAFRPDGAGSPWRALLYGPP